MLIDSNIGFAFRDSQVFPVVKFSALSIHAEETLWENSNRVGIYYSEATLAVFGDQAMAALQEEHLL